MLTADHHAALKISLLGIRDYNCKIDNDISMKRKEKEKVYCHL